MLLILQAPVALVRGLMSPYRAGYLYLVPAVSILSFTGFTLYQYWFGRSVIADRYRIGAFNAIEQQDFPLAKTYLMRLMDLGDLTQLDEISLATILGATGASDDANAILDSLAPESGTPGFAPAHRQKVGLLLRQLGKTNDPNHLSKLKRHLDCAGKDIPEMQPAWVTYYFAIGDVENASQTLVNMSNVAPAYWLALADICQKQGNLPKRTRALEAAKKVCEEKIQKDAFDFTARVDLAKVLTRQNNLDDAEQVLLKGLQLKPDNPMKLAASQFYLVRYDKSTAAGESFSQRFEYLQKAMRLAAGSSGVYDRLTALFMNESDEEERKAIRNEFLALVAGDNPSAIAHFALSNLYQAEGDSEKAVWHLEQAYTLDNGLVVVANNLAWMLAHQKEPDLDKALKFAEQAVKNSPNSDFLDTYATVLMLRKEYQLAITEFEKAIGGSRTKQLIHKKLAECYRQIGRQELAEIHERNAAPPVD
jgi:tetratricopeptide (TPR) repeat protein